MIHIPNFNSLTEGEKFIVKWQYNMLGSFESALVSVIQRADIINLSRLILGFPEEVEAFLSFGTIKEWWPEVQKRAGIVE